MPIDAQIPLMVQAPPPVQQPASPLDSLAKVLQVKNALGQGPIQAQQLQAATLENQQRQQAITDQQASDSAFKSAFTTDGNGVTTLDRDKLIPALPGHMLPGVMKSLDEMDKSRTDLQKAQQEVQKATQIHAAGWAQSVKAAGYDPTFALGSLKSELSQKIITQAQYDQASTPIIQANQQDPTGAAGKAVVQKMTDGLIASAPPEVITAQAKADAAATSAAKEAREAAVQQRSQALQQAGGVTDDASYQSWIARNPVLKTEAPPQFDPAFVARIAREAVPAKDQPEYDIQTKTAQAMAAMKPGDWQAQIDIVAPPKGDTAGLNQRTRVLVNSAVSRGDYKAAQSAIKDASDQQGRVDVAKKEGQNKITLDMGSFTGANGGPSETAKSVANYQESLQTALARVPPGAREEVMKQIHQLNPEFHQEYFNNFQKTEIDASTGKIGTNANALNTMMGHLSILDQAAGALKNGDIQAINKIANYVGAQTGSTAQTTYDTIVHRLGPEVTKAYIASGGSVGERGTNESDFSRNLGPDQIKANIGVSAQLADSKIKALQDQYSRGTYGRGQQKLISGEAEQARQRLAGNSPVQGGNMKVASPQSKADYDALPSGAHYLKNGTEMVKQ